MANTTFVDGTTPILASWLNDVNKAVYSGTFPSLTTFTLGGLSYSDIGLGFVYGISTNGYAQDIIQNTSSGTAASADYIVSNNLGTSSTYYGDFGMNSSTFSGTGSLSLPNATYLYSANGDLVLGTQTSNAIHFVVNNGATDAGTLYPTGAWNLAAPTSLATTLYLTQYAGSYGYGFQLWGSDGTNGTNARIGNSSVTGAASLSFSAANGANYGYLNAYSGGMSLIAQDATSVLNLGTNNVTRLVISNAGNVTINAPSSAAALITYGQIFANNANAGSPPFNPFTAATAGVQCHFAGTTASNLGGYVSAEYATTFGGAGPSYVMQRSHGNVLGAQGALIAGDTIGLIGWSGSDGTNFQQCASIYAAAISNYAAASVPTYMQFNVVGSGTTLVAALQLNSTNATFPGTINNVNVRTPSSATVGNGAAITTVETYSASAQQIAANTMYAGNHYRITLYGICTSTGANTVTFNARVGTAGTTSDAIVGAVATTAAISGVNQPFKVVFELCVDSIGAGGVVSGSGIVYANGGGVASLQNTIGTLGTGTVNTTVINYIGLSLVSSGATTTVTVNRCLVEMIR